MAINFREILSTPVDEIERPKSIPACHLIARQKVGPFGATRGNGTPYVRFLYTPIGPGPDVSPKDLEGFSFGPGAPGEIDITEREMRLDMWITPRALNRLDRMMDACLGENTNKRTCDERLPDMDGIEVMIQVVPRMNEDGTDSGYNDVVNVVAAPSA